LWYDFVLNVSKAQAQYTASELLKMRDIISSEIKTALINRARDFHIIIDEVNLVRSTSSFVGDSSWFRRTLDLVKNSERPWRLKKLVSTQDYVVSNSSAQQDAERGKFLVDRAKQDKRSAIIRALGEAKSIELLGSVGGLTL
jgi:prohibitin 2